MTQARSPKHVYASAIWRLSVVSCCATISLTWAEESLTRQHAATLARALSYDYRLKSRAGTAVRLAIIYKPKNEASEQSSFEALRALKVLEAIKIQSLPVNVTRIGYENLAGLRKVVDNQAITILYVCGGLSRELPVIKELSRSKKIITVGSQIEFVKRGLSLGVFLVENQMKVFVNLTAAREEGSQFSADLLRVAEVVQ